MSKCGECCASLNHKAADMDAISECSVCHQDLCSECVGLHIQNIHRLYHDEGSSVSADHGALHAPSLTSAVSMTNGAKLDGQTDAEFAQQISDEYDDWDTLHAVKVARAEEFEYMHRLRTTTETLQEIPGVPVLAVQVCGAERRAIIY